MVNALLHSRKFWLAVFGLIQTIVFHFLPHFPPEVWQAIDALVVVLIAAIAAEDVALKRAGKSHTADPDASPYVTKYPGD